MKTLLQILIGAGVVGACILLAALVTFLPTGKAKAEAEHPARFTYESVDDIGITHFYLVTDHQTGRKYLAVAGGGIVEVAP